MTSQPVQCPACKANLVADSRFCHRCGLPLSGERPAAGSRWDTDVLRGLIIVSCLVWIIGWAVGFVDAEGVTGGAFLSTFLGVGMIVAGVHARYTWSVILGMAHACMFGLCFALIGIFGWTPAGGEGQKPMLILGMFYLMAIVPLSVYAYRQAPQMRHPWVCQRCGYLLRGLSESRCPECGLPFGPARTRPVAGPTQDPDRR